MTSLRGDPAPRDRVGFFNVLDAVAREVFGGALDDDFGKWQFPMGDITVGALMDILGRPMLRWHNESGGPTACVSIVDYELAEQFRDQFQVHWLSAREERDRGDEVLIRDSS